MLDWKDRQERIEARGAEYRAGAMTEDQFRGYLFAMRLRGEDLQHQLRHHAPAPPAKTFEEHRLDVSRQWLKGRLQR